MITIDLTKSLHSSSGTLMLNVNLTAEAGQTVALYGESGSGKTSILKMFAGLLKPDSGRITVGGLTWYDSELRINLSPQRRSVGFVFQDFALFPTLSVKRNLEYALPRGGDKRTIDELIHLMSLGELQHQLPGRLSGGQKQRVALARALAQQPDILLLDEPFAAIDRNMRDTIQEYLKRYQANNQATLLLVTHDVGEVQKMADKVYVLKNGKFDRGGAPVDMFTRQLSAKFSFTGTILRVDREDIIWVVTVMIGNHSVKVVAHDDEVKDLNPGDEVIVASKAFNPIIQKVLR